MIAAGSKITLAEFLALPDDGVERWVKNGILFESQSGEDMSRRNHEHCYSMTRVAKFLDNWNDEQPEPSGRVYTGDVGIILSNGEVVTYGVDVAYVSAQQLVEQTDDTTMISGAPTIAIEILSPSNLSGELNDKIQTLLDYGTREVWVLDPYWKVIDVYRPGQGRYCVFGDQSLESPGILPGFAVKASLLFESTP